MRLRRFSGIEDLSALVREALGPQFRVVGAERLRGGSKKGVYRVHADGPRAVDVIVYRWAEAENFWPDAGAGAVDAADPFAPASGLVPFLAAQRHLDGLGVRVPQILAVDDSRSRQAADMAVVEDVGGRTLEELLAEDPVRGEEALGEIGGMLDVMHRQHGPRHGRLDVLERGGTVSGASCPQVVLDRALADLDEAAARDSRLGSAAEALRERLHEHAGRIAPRTGHGLIHGELGPDHVLITTDGRPVLIDIEGVMYFDVEWEHVFLQIRFGERYSTLARPGLDPRRLDLYMLAMRLSLVAGPLRLLDGDFPEREVMLGIAEHNLNEALALLP